MELTELKEKACAMLNGTLIVNGKKIDEVEETDKETAKDMAEHLNFALEITRQFAENLLECSIDFDDDNLFHTVEKADDNVQ